MDIFINLWLSAGKPIHVGENFCLGIAKSVIMVSGILGVFQASVGVWLSTLIYITQLSEVFSDPSKALEENIYWSSHSMRKFSLFWQKRFCHNIINLKAQAFNVRKKIEPNNLP